jgi:hypothetical protein
VKRDRLQNIPSLVENYKICTRSGIVYVLMPFQQDLFILPCHAYPLACGLPGDRRVRARAPGNADGGQQAMQSPFPGRPVGMPGRRFIGSGQNFRSCRPVEGGRWDGESLAYGSRLPIDRFTVYRSGIKGPEKGSIRETILSSLVTP